MFTLAPITRVLPHDLSAAFTLHRCPAFAQLSDDRATTGAADVIRSCCYLRSHASLAERAFTGQPIGFRDTHRIDGAFFIGAPASINGIDIGENEEQFGAQFSRKNRGSEVLVDDSIDAFEAQRWIPVNGNAAAPTRDYDGVAIEQQFNCR